MARTLVGSDGGEILVPSIALERYDAVFVRTR